MILRNYLGLLICDIRLKNQKNIWKNLAVYSGNLLSVGHSLNIKFYWEK